MINTAALKALCIFLDRLDYIGCFKDNSVRDVADFKFHSDNKLTVEKCIKQCATGVREIAYWFSTFIV